MNEELERKLLTKYPRIFAIDQSSPTAPTYRGVECGDGWFVLLERLCDDIQVHVDAHLVPQVTFTQLKEKFGELRVYHLGGDGQVEDLINIAESASKITCENCGSLGLRQRTRHGWIKTLCTPCMDRANRN